MTTLPVFNAEGKKIEDMTVSDAVFAVPKNDDLLHQAYTVLAGNIRVATAHTKNRAERAGSGKKPWKQKGTGRARVGSVRSPIWRKGGVVFGPRSERNFVRALNVKMRRKAMAIALSEKVRAGACTVADIEENAFAKTKEVAKMIASFGAKGSIVFGVGADEQEMLRVLQNIPRLSGAFAQDLNVCDMLDVKNVVLTKKAVRMLEARLKANQQ